MFSPLDASSGKSLDEELLEKQEQQCNGQTDQQAGGSEIAPSLSGAGNHGRKADGQGVHVVGCVKRQRKEELVPRSQETEQRRHGHRRKGKRQDDLREDLKLGATVEQGGFFQLPWDGVKEPFEHPNTQRKGRPQ